MTLTRWLQVALFAAAISLASTAAAEEAVRQIELADPLPYGQAPIDYSGPASDDAIARLLPELAASKVKLAGDSEREILRPLLDLLHVPVESQLLVFSKTALHPQLVGPTNPRAIYFNDEVTIGWVPGAKAFEMSAIDPQKGAIFYVVRADSDKPPVLTRENRCLTCHASGQTLGVPGLMLRSFVTDAKGSPLHGFSQISHATPLAKRWGGWYVTGSFGGQHLGNIVGADEEQAALADPAANATTADLTGRFDASTYPTPYSDVVAQLVFTHQMHGQNLLTRVGQEARLNRRSDAEEQLLRYLLFVDEPLLSVPIAGNSGFREWFERQGPRDSQGRSLREFDLETRVFKHRLSYLIETRAFDELPAEVKERLYRRLWDVLNSPHEPSDYAKIPQAERAAIIDILRETKRDLPDDWNAG